MGSDAGKLFIGGISWETTEEKLKNYFSRYGAVVEAIIMKDRTTGRARGFGFIIYADPAVADKVVQQKHSIDGRTVEAKKAVPKDEQNAFRNDNGSIASPSQARTKKIFVGGLAPTVTESDFRKYFEQFGSITDVVVMYDNATQRPRGFGFITYTSEDAVEKVLQNTFHELKDKMVEVKRAIPKELSPGPMRNNVGGFNSGIARGLSGTGYVHGLNSPIPPYGTRMGGRYGLSVAGDYSPYGTTYSNFNINPGYGASPYGGIAELTWGGGGPNIGSLYGGGRGGYGGSMSTRNLWSNRGIGYVGSGGSLYRGMGGASTLGDFSGLGNWGSLQSPNSGGRYGTSNSGYGRIEGGYGSGGLGYTRVIGDYGSTGGSRYGNSIDGGLGLATGSFLTSGSGSGSSVYGGGYGNFYSGTSYAEASRKSSGFGMLNPSESLGSGELGYGLSVSSSEVAAAGYSDGYALARLPNRGIPS